VGVEQNLALHFEFRKDEKPKNKGFSRISCQNRLLTVEDRLEYRFWAEQFHETKHMHRSVVCLCSA